MSIYGETAAGHAASAAANYNARLEQQQGMIARSQSFEKSAQIGQNTQRVLGAARAAGGAGGVDVNAGSSIAVARDTASQGELSAKLAQYQGRVSQLSADEQAGLDLYQGRAAKQAGYISADGTLLTGVAQTAQQGVSVYG
jgi:hypothetical protein